MDRVQNLLTVLREKPYRLMAWLFSFAYLGIILGVYTYMYNGNLFLFYHTFPMWYIVSSTILNIVVSIMGGVAITVFIAKIRELHVKSAGIGITGILIGSLAAGCPGCFFGLFPLVLSFFGISGTLAMLPFYGVELQVVTILLLGISLYFLSGEYDLTCEIPKK